MSLKDKINFGDGISPHGYIIIRDKNGNVILQKHNMIVKEGRKILLAHFLGSVIDSENASNNDSLNALNGLKDFYFYGVCFSKCSKETEAGDTTDTMHENNSIFDLSDNNPYFFNLNSNNKTLSNETLVKGITVDADDVCISFNITFSTDISHSQDITALNSLGIILKKDNEDKYALFSRVNFDPIPLQDGSTYTLTYYVYF